MLGIWNLNLKAGLGYLFTIPVKQTLSLNTLILDMEELKSNILPKSQLRRLFIILDMELKKEKVFAMALGYFLIYLLSIAMGFDFEQFQKENHIQNLFRKR